MTDPAAYDRPGRTDWATGAVLAISRRCVDALGPWDESYFLYSEEVDYMLRAADAAFSVRYEPTATAVHLGGQSGTDERLWALLTRNRISLYRNRHGRARTAAFASGVVLNEAIRAGLGRQCSRTALRSLLGRPREPGLGRRRPGVPRAPSGRRHWGGFTGIGQAGS